MLEEKELVGQVIKGISSAEEEFFRRFRPRLYRASLYFLGAHDSEAEDIVQDTFIIALPKLQFYDFCAPIYAWLRQICLRLCYARMRKRSRTVITMHEDLEIFMKRMALERMQNLDLDRQRELKLELMRRMKLKLNPGSRRIIDLRGLQGMSYAQISEELKIPMGTVMSRLARAREQLKKLMQDAPKPDLILVLKELEKP